jgi:peroxiredoxin Q/BCP
MGSKVPHIELPMTGDISFELKNYKGKFVILFFYPKDATPGCTLEAHEFSEFKKKFEKLNAVVFGVSRDSLKSHAKFKDKQCYSVDLISDENEELCSLFGVVKDKNMYGKKVRGIERSTFVISPDGKLLQEWRKVRAEGHAKEVFNWLKAHLK